MNSPTPAIVAQAAVRRLPRLALLLFCLAYVLPGFIGRDPWRNADMQGFGYMYELARGATDWFRPEILGFAPEFDALLPYWLGAWAIQATAGWLAPDVAVRLPAIGWLALTLAATWYATYHLARTPRAQPVPFAFGGEADPTDYARALADAGLLALVACLGLAQFSHETTPSGAQLGLAALAFYGLAALGRPRAWPPLALALGLAGLALSGGPTLAVLFGATGAAVLALQAREGGEATPAARASLVAAAITVGVAVLASALDLWRLRLDLADSAAGWRGLVRLVAWFTWPVWPLALWTTWRWRRQLASPHVALPLALAGLSLASALTTPNADRSLLLALPALAALAAFALPTLRRSVSALIDWFTLLFFSGIALVIWVVWISLQTGVPAKPAANVARLAVGFEPSFSLPAFLAALAGTLAWAALVRWRAGRHRAALWKSLVLPAAGAALCWLLLMTLWLPVLDYARSYVPGVRAVLRATGPEPGCVEVGALTRGQMTALAYHGNLALRPAGPQPVCAWRVTAAQLASSTASELRMDRWELVSTIRRPSDPRENLRVWRKRP
ncbi:hypothetical protein ACT80S_12800 [Ramlibacter sp. MAHUQ-53]|uniref:hypothetical protein n=1 Tax=unclassified Ramlibacter TaxID=2617605 RepID=UPI003630B1EB